MTDTATAAKAVAAPSKTGQPRLKQKYRDEIAAQLKKDFGFTNVHQVPGLVKIVVNTGVGEAARDGKIIDGAVKDLTAITGQKPQVTNARKSIAQFTSHFVVTARGSFSTASSRLRSRVSVTSVV
jgi:large subunit ribosomal protein L5